MTHTFKHSGDLGDIIFSLPAVRALGGGILYLDPKGGQDSTLGPELIGSGTRLNAAAIDSLRPLLARQPYIAEVRHWSGEAVEYDLDRFRAHLRFKNISDSHLAAFGLPLVERDSAWLTVDDPISVAGRPIVISRSVRYHSNYTFWLANLPRIGGQSIFVGDAKDHEIFEYTFGQRVEYFPTPEITTLARVLAGAGRVMCNQGFPHALAEGMKKDLVHEVYRVIPAAIFRRPGAMNV